MIDNNNTSSFVIKAALAIEKEKFNMPSQQLPSGYESNNTWQYLHGLQLVNVEPSKVTVVIGADVPEAFIQLDIKRGQQGQPLAIQTPFGWAIFGSSKSQENDTKKFAVNTTFTSELNDAVKKLWEFDSKIEHQSNEGDLSQNDKRCIEKLEQDTKLVDNKYEVPMLWLNKDIKFPNNYHMAIRRFKLLKNRLQRNSELKEKYVKTVQGYIDKGYARKMSKQETHEISQRTWYLPHHPVFDDKKPGKIRLVFDAAGTCNGTSLNKVLLTGPDLLNNLVGVLLRVRNHKIAIAADIEAMYHQVKVTQTDADSLRFLWQDDLNNGNPDTYQMVVHIFGGKDSPSCANYALKRTGSDNAASSNPSTVESVLKSFYMDDFLKSVISEEQAKDLCKEMIDIRKKGGFNLTKFKSNSINVLKALPEDKCQITVQQLEIDGDQTERTLGVHWRINEDYFTFTRNMKDYSTTKRGILSAISSVFDPLGFLTPFTLKAKLIIQEMWRQNLDWDEEVPIDILKVWKR